MLIKHHKIPTLDRSPWDPFFCVQIIFFLKMFSHTMVIVCKKFGPKTEVGSLLFFHIDIIKKTENEENDKFSSFPGDPFFCVQIFFFLNVFPHGLNLLCKKFGPKTEVGSLSFFPYCYYQKDRKRLKWPIWIVPAETHFSASKSFFSWICFHMPWTYSARNLAQKLR